MSGLTGPTATKAMLSYCGKCQQGMPTGGDRAILKDRSGTEAIYWCWDCYSADFELTEGKKLSAN